MCFQVGHGASDPADTAVVTEPNPAIDSQVSMVCSSAGIVCWKPHGCSSHGRCLSAETPMYYPLQAGRCKR